MSISWFALIFQPSQITEAEISHVIRKPFTVTGEDSTVADTLRSSGIYKAYHTIKIKIYPEYVRVPLRWSICVERNAVYSVMRYSIYIVTYSNVLELAQQPRLRWKQGKEAETSFYVGKRTTLGVELWLDDTPPGPKEPMSRVIFEFACANWKGRGFCSVCLN